LGTQPKKKHVGIELELEIQMQKIKKKGTENLEVQIHQLIFDFVSPLFCSKFNVLRINFILQLFQQKICQ
jgi:hypothetical protein